MTFRVHRGLMFRSLISHPRRGGAFNEEVIAMHTDLTLQAFQDLLDRHGDRLDWWPAVLRVRAEALLRESAEARAALEQARKMRVQLRHGAPEVKAPPDFVARVMARAMEASENEPNEDRSPTKGNGRPKPASSNRRG